MENNNKIGIYHCVLKNETFEEAAKDIFDLVKKTAAVNQTKKRIFYLDIEGHRNKEGIFDKDMLELQKEFMLTQIMPYLTELYQPLCHIENKEQKDFDLEEIRIA